MSLYDVTFPAIIIILWIKRENSLTFKLPQSLVYLSIQDSFNTYKNRNNGCSVKSSSRSICYMFWSIIYKITGITNWYNIKRKPSTQLSKKKQQSLIVNDRCIRWALNKCYILFLFPQQPCKVNVRRSRGYHISIYGILDTMPSR